MSFVLHSRVDVPGACARTLAEQYLQVFVEMNHRSANKVRVWLDQLSTTTKSIEVDTGMVVQEEVEIR